LAPGSVQVQAKKSFGPR